jgi:hypothetical protein
MQEGIAMGYERRCNLAITPQHLLNYATSKAANPHTYGGAPDAMAYGGSAAPTEAQVEMMLAELKERDAKKASFRCAVSLSLGLHRAGPCHSSIAPCLAWAGARLRAL